MQRLFDILFSLIAILAILPLFFVLIILLRFTGEGEVFFTQSRIGLDGKTFGLLKFVTMIKNSPNMGTGTITVKNDPRILPLGKFLRKTKINELPQLFNIFRGDMSVIGPRPLTRETFQKYSVNSQKLITKLRPGLSGIGSIVFRNEEEILSQKSDSINFYDNHIATYKSLLEVWYVENFSMKIYFILILLTIWVVLFPGAGNPIKYFQGIPKPSDELMEYLDS